MMFLSNQRMMNNTVLEYFYTVFVIASGNQKRIVWAFSPTTKKVESKKLYNRKKSARAWKDDFGMSAFACPELFRNKDLREKICKWRSPKRCCWQRLC